MTFALLAVATAAAVLPAAAQDHSTQAGHAATATAPAVTAPPAAAKFSLDTPVEALMADARSKAVVDAVVPNVAAHPSYDQFKAMSFNQLAPLAADQLTPEKLAQLKTGLEAIK